MSERTPGIRPRQSLRRRLDIAARLAFPAATTILLLLLAAAPAGLPGQAQLQPAVTLGCVFFWSLFRPASLPPALVFCIGLLLDLIGLAPVGLWEFLLLATYGVALRSRRTLVRQGFVLVWVAFILVALVASLLSWAVSSLLALAMLPLLPVLFQAVLAAALYPLLSALLTWAHRGIADPRQA